MAAVRKFFQPKLPEQKELKQEIRAELVSVGYLFPLANLIDEYISLDSYVNAILASSKFENNGEAWAAISRCIFRFIKNGKTEEVTNLFQSKKLDTYFSFIMDYCGSSKDSVERYVGTYFLTEKMSHFSETKMDAAESKDPFVSSLVEAKIRDAAKTHIHSLIETNDAASLSLLISKVPGLLQGEQQRHFNYVSFDGVSKITNEELAITTNSIEALRVLLDYSENRWISHNAKYPKVKNILDFAIFKNGPRVEEFCRFIIRSYLKKLCSCLRLHAHFIPENSVSANIKNVGHLLLDFLENAITLTSNPKILCEIKETQQLLELRLDQLEERIAMIESQEETALEVEPTNSESSKLRP